MSIYVFSDEIFKGVLKEKECDYIVKSQVSVLQPVLIMCDDNSTYWPSGYIPGTNLRFSVSTF